MKIRIKSWKSCQAAKQEEEQSLDSATELAKNGITVTCVCVSMCEKGDVKVYHEVHWSWIYADNFKEIFF